MFNKIKLKTRIKQKNKLTKTYKKKLLNKIKKYNKKIKIIQILFFKNKNMIKLNFKNIIRL